MPTFNRSFNGGGSRAVVTDLEVDPSDSTVSVDETNNRLGIGTTTPGTQLELEGETPYITLKNSTAENTDGGCETKLIFEDHAAASLGQIEVHHSGSADDTKGKMILSTHTGSSLTAAVTIDEAQKVTAAGDVQVTGDIILDDGGSIKEAGGTAAITIDGDGHVTKIGQDSPSSGQFLKYDGAKWVADSVASGSSAADDITGGDAAVNITTTAGNITLDAQGNDTDIIFKGTDGGSDTTFLTLDGSDAGAASFNGAVTVGADLTVTGGDTTLGAAGDTTATTISTVTNTGTNVGKSLTISAGSTTTGSNNLNGGDLILSSGGGDGTGTSSIQFKTKVSGTDAAAERMRIHTDGNVGIGTNAPGNMLHVAGADAYVLLQNTTDENGDGQAETRVLFGDHSGSGLAQIEGSHSGSSDDTKGKFSIATSNGSSLATALTIDDTRKATFTTTSTNSVEIDQQYSVTDASALVGLDIDIDKTGASSTNNSMIGINLDMDNTSATGGTNTMTGMKVTPTLIHAADGGTTLAKGIEVVVTGGTPGGSTARALDLTATGADFNQGIYMAIADGGPDIKMVSSADSGDFATIAVGAAGATTFTTVDNGGAAANLRFDVDGDFEVEPAGDVVIKNTVNDANGARIKFVKDKGAAGADGDDIGVIEFVGDDAAQTQTSFAKIVAEVSEADDSDEAGKLSFFVAESDGTTTALTAGLVIEGEHATDGQVNVTLGAGVQSVTNTSGKFGVFDTTPMTAINVVNNYNTVTFENQLASGEGGGRVMRYSPGADDTLTVGRLYFLHTDGTWDETDADAVATGATQLLGIGLGNARTAGCLMEGFIRIPSTEIEGTPGSGAVDGLPLYVSTTAGHITFTRPSAAGDFVRIVGHAIDDHSSDVLIYFNPSNNHVEL